MPTKDEKVGILMSSGIDSIALLERYSKTSSLIYPIYIQSGLRWEECELYWLKKFLRSLRLNNVEALTVLSYPLKDTYGSHWSITGVKVPGVRAKYTDIFLPGRNLVLLSKGALFCAMNQIPTLAIGINKTYPFDDGQSQFFKHFETLSSKSCGRDFKIAQPFLDKSKEEIMYEAKELGFEYSSSCLSPKGHQHCGDCFKCGERKRAFARSGITDKTLYYRKHSHTVGSS